MQCLQSLKVAFYLSSITLLLLTSETVVVAQGQVQKQPTPTTKSETPIRFYSGPPLALANGFMLEVEKHGQDMVTLSKLGSEFTFPGKVILNQDCAEVVFPYQKTGKAVTTTKEAVPNPTRATAPRPDSSRPEPPPAPDEVVTLSKADGGQMTVPGRLVVGQGEAELMLPLANYPKVTVARTYTSTSSLRAEPKRSEAKRGIEHLLPKPSEIHVTTPRPTAPPPVKPTTPPIIGKLHPVLPPHLHVGGGKITVTPTAGGGGKIGFDMPLK